MEEARQRVWDGKVYLIIEVHEPLSYGPQKYLLAIHRISYLYLYLPRIIQYFDKYLDHTNKAPLHFTYDNEVLTPTKPIGVLYDMYIGTVIKPWRIQLERTDDSPLEFQNIDEIKILWTNNLKESCYINHGNSKPVMLLTPTEHDKLFKQISSPSELKSCNEYWDVVDKMFKPQLKVPIKLYIKVNGKYEVHLRTMHKDDKLMDLQMNGAKINRMVTHGIHLKAKMQFGTLYTLFSYPDGFLHLVITT